ncbi:MAG TPA: oxidoreductase [Cytophagales bacterium]|nr:oxidoreductase [Cytophagales bacterium]HAP58400.1 oxidoreductase [Cytophagales bacterium]
MRLKDKVAFVTGGNSGIGLATAQRFAQEGAKVAITARRQAAVEEFNRGAPKDSMALLADAQDLAANQLALQKAADTFGKLDILFLNAGIGKPTPFEAVQPEGFQSVFKINVEGLFFTVQAAIPHLNEGASIILNGSIAGGKGSNNNSVYSATKAAVRSLARTLTRELAPRGIRVNNLSPGVIETPIWGKTGIPESDVEAFKEGAAQAIPMGRLGTAEEVASAVLFLASDDARYITGIDLPVDGGLAQI